MTQKTLCVGHKPGLTGARHIKTDIYEMARSANNFVNIFQRCLGNFKEAPMLIPPSILAHKKQRAYLLALVADHGGSLHNWSGWQEQNDSTQIRGDLRGAGLLIRMPCAVKNARCGQS